MANIISFKMKKKEYQKKECKHNSILIDKKKWTIECEDCGDLLDPIWYLSYLADSQKTIDYKTNKLIDEYNSIIEKINKKNRVKCQHCGKMTNIIKS